MNRTDNKKNNGFRWIIGIVVLVAAVVIVAMNTVLVFNMTKEQTLSDGTQQIKSMTVSLQAMLNDAAYKTENLAFEVQRKIYAGISQEELRDYIYLQSEIQSQLTGGKCFNVCYTSPDIVIVPGYDVPDDLDINTRIWYRGAIEKGRGQSYISSPYVDLATGEICFTVAKLIEDGATVSLDFSLGDIRDIISQIKYDKGTSILLNADGMIVNSTEDIKPGSDVKEVLPDYNKIIETVLSSTKTEESFEMNGKTVFYNCTENEWYLIYIIDRGEFYKDTYSSLLRNTILGLVLVLAIAVFIIRENRRSQQVSDALSARDEFFGNLSDELSVPVKQIINNSNPKTASDSNISAIREAALKLSEVVDNMFAYSGILAKDKKERDADKSLEIVKKNTTKISVARLNTILLSVIYIITCIFSYFMLREQAADGMNREINKYTSLLTEEMSSKFTTFDVIASGIEADPGIMMDYDITVNYLRLLDEKYDDISLVYIGDAALETPVMMSDGWIPGINYVIQAYPWYSDAIKDDKKLIMSAPFFDTDSRCYCITLSRTLYSEYGSLIGVLGIDFKLESITNVLEENYEDGDYAFLVTNNGIIINHPSKEYAISTTNKKLVDELNYYKAFGRDGFIPIIDYDGVPSFCMEYDDGVSGFHVVVVKEMFSLLGGMLIVTVLFLIFMLVCIIIVITFMLRNIRIQEDQNRNLQLAMEQAQSADDAKTRFIAMISHELRTPINAILGLNEMIQRTTVDAEIIGYSKDLSTSGKGLLELVNEILDYSKFENGKMELVEVEYNIKDFVFATLSAIEERTKKAGLELIVEVDENIPSKLYGDETHIRQVLLNLLTNAIKYTNAGYVKFIAQSRLVSEDVVMVRFEVEDTGIGIKPENIEKLSESFSRFDLERNRNIEGTGLGLYIVNQFLSLLNSKLEVSSVYGEGSNFGFTLFQKIVNPEPIGVYGDNRQETMKIAVAADDEVLYAPDASIMIVDDNEINIKVAVGLLKRSKAHTVTALSGNECIEKLKKEKVDIILMDYMMPEMDGIETLKIIRDEQLSDVPVLVMTANAVSSFREEYARAGFDDFISKPIDSALFEKMLYKWLPKDKADFVSLGNIPKKIDINYGPFEEYEVKAFTDKAPEVNFMEGLHSCGEDKDFYYEIISDYITSSNIKDMDNALEKGSIKDYQIKVHALKSTSRSIGAAELGEEAYELELAAKEGKLDVISEKNPMIKKHFKELSEKLTEVLNICKKS